MKKRQAFFCLKECYTTCLFFLWKGCGLQIYWPTPTLMTSSVKRSSESSSLTKREWDFSFIIIIHTRFATSLVTIVSKEESGGCVSRQSLCDGKWFINFLSFKSIPAFLLRILLLLLYTFASCINYTSLVLLSVSSSWVSIVLMKAKCAHRLVMSLIVIHWRIDWRNFVITEVEQWQWQAFLKFQFLSSASTLNINKENLNSFTSLYQSYTSDWGS